MKIAFLGGGNMASALIGGLIAKGYERLDFGGRDPGGARAARREHPVRVRPRRTTPQGAGRRCSP